MQLLYRLEQFNDVLLQENTSSIDTTSPLFDISDLHTITDNQFFPVEALKVCIKNLMCDD